MREDASAGTASAVEASADTASAGKSSTGKSKNLGGKRYRQLRVWQVAHQFALAVYEATKAFPSHEQFGLTSQLRRAALSVPTNIVEGQASFSKREFANFLTIASRSLSEVEYLLDVANDLGYLSDGERDRLDQIRYETGRLLQALRMSL